MNLTRYLPCDEAAQQKVQVFSIAWSQRTSALPLECDGQGGRGVCLPKPWQRHGWLTGSSGTVPSNERMLLS
jgi:hypothetical protein